jgi:DNA (cytosine-5)-methyltransferase 1
MGKLKVLSLFSGIGAFEKALTNLGVDYELVGFSEIDKYAITSYCAIHNADESLNVGDISKVDKSKLPDFDLLVGGSPCQAFSVAGQRKGFEDTRGTLFFEYVDTLKHKQPKFFVFENVKGLINHDKGKTLNIIAESFSEVGYRIDMELLNSKYFDVPQNRERIYIVGIREDLIEQQGWIIPKERKDVMTKGKRRIKELGIKMFNFDFPKQEKVSKVIRDILESNVDEKYYLSEDKTKKLIEKLESEQHYKNGTIFDGKNGFGKMKTYNDIAPTILSNDYKEPKKIVEEIDLKMVGRIDIKGNDSIHRAYSTDGVAPTLTTMEGGHREPKIVVEYDRKNGIGKELDIAHTLNSSDWRGLNRNQKQNAVLESKIIDDTQNFDGIRLYDEIAPTLKRERHGLKVAEEFLIDDQGRSNKKLKPMDISPTLRSESHGNEPKIVESYETNYREIIEKDIRQIVTKTRPNEKIEITFKENGDIRPHRMDAKKSGISELNINHENNPSFTVTSSHAPKIYGKTTHYRIRKLTPLECWRLQAFSDEDFKKAKEVGISDSQLYKQAGNSITVTVLEAIFKKLLHTYLR